MNPSELLKIENPAEAIGFTTSVILVALVLFFLILAIVLSYHWRKYGVGRVRAAIFMWTYLIGGVIFIGAMVAAKLSY